MLISKFNENNVSFDMDIFKKAENCFGDTFCIDSTDWYSPVENFKENKL